MYQIQMGTILTDAGLKNVVHYGDKTPEPPYVVIKPGKDPLARGTAFKVIAHRDIGQIYELDQDIQKIITALKPTLWQDSEDYDPTVYAGHRDNTISREQNFLLVSKY